MARRETFWTPSKLKELKRLFKTMTMPQLERHFARRKDDILQAYEFQRMHKILKIKRTSKKGVTTTLYRPGHAEGSVGSKSYRCEEFYA